MYSIYKSSYNYIVMLKTATCKLAKSHYNITLKVLNHALFFNAHYVEYITPMFEVEKFRGFCGIGFGHTRLLSKRGCFPVNYSLVLQL